MGNSHRVVFLFDKMFCMKFCSNYVRDDKNMNFSREILSSCMKFCSNYVRNNKNMNFSRGNLSFGMKSCSIYVRDDENMNFSRKISNLEYNKII